MFNSLRNLLLALLLLGAQTALSLHQLDFDQHAEGAACQLCLAAQGLDHALSAHGALCAPSPVAGAPLATPADAPAIALAVVGLPRAPPVLTAVPS